MSLWAERSHSLLLPPSQSRMCTCETVQKKLHETFCTSWEKFKQGTASRLAKWSELLRHVHARACACLVVSVHTQMRTHLSYITDTQSYITDTQSYITDTQSYITVSNSWSLPDPSKPFASSVLAL